MPLVARTLPPGTIVHVDGVPVMIDAPHKCSRCGADVRALMTSEDANWEALWPEVEKQQAAREAAATELMNSDRTLSRDRAIARVDADAEKFTKRAGDVKAEPNPGGINPRPGGLAIRRRGVSRK